jgi:proteasome alpha subunit
MSMPFYVSPEQVMADKAEFASKGVARGKPSIVIECDAGILMMAENLSTLSKIGEIYDRVAFAGVGKFSEFDQLRKIGVRYADIKGYAYSRDDVRGRALANAYSQAVGDAFTQQLKPLEVEIVVVEVGDSSLAGHENNAIYRIQYDGSISDHHGHCVIGGAAEDLSAFLDSRYRDGIPLGEAIGLAKSALERATEGEPSIDVKNLEVCLLERERQGRKFVRLNSDRVGELMSA